MKMTPLAVYGPPRRTSTGALALATIALGLLVLTGCASTGPGAKSLQVQVISEPPGLTVWLDGESLGPAPLELGMTGLDQAAHLTVAESATDRVLERRIQVLAASRIRVLLTVRDAPSDLAQALGLGDILVFDYGERATFAVDSYELGASIVPLLQDQAALLRGRFAEVDLFVCGHTDSSGEDDHNHLLSLRRAQAVADLLERHGISRERMNVQGFAADYPLAPNSTAAGRTLNRRTEIVIGQ